MKTKLKSLYVKSLRTVLMKPLLYLAGVILFGAFFFMPVPYLPSATYSDFMWAHLGDKFSQRHLAASYLLGAAQGHDSYEDKAEYWKKRAGE